MVTPANYDQLAQIALARVHDPEIPVVNVLDLGIVREWVVDGSRIDVTITPTYSGCPAMEVIEREIAESLREWFDDITVHTVLAPPWTTDWITPHGRAKLREAGIAPPAGHVRVGAGSTRISTPLALVDDAMGSPSSAAGFPPCPRCDSTDVERISEFGSTACKSLWRCRACSEPFDHFKPL
jgi:ring-1,2-phenylacetyl-CoA epoxidase subunit PaaD